MDEFALIERFFSRPNSAQDIVVGMGDDAAIIHPPTGQHWVVATDTLVEGVHFPAGVDAHAIGYRVLATNLSDLAAMGAVPSTATLALTLPTADADWLKRFSEGFFELAQRHHVTLIGGDTTRGPLTVTVGIHGTVAPGQALRRDGAQLNDDIYVTGALGAAAAQLAQYRVDSRAVRGPYLYPTPRIQEALMLRPYAHAGIDISDGLVADAGHMAHQSNIAIELDMACLPIAHGNGATQAMALHGGDDYELLVSMPPAQAETCLRHWRKDLAPLTRIGRVVKGQGVRGVNADGQTIHLKPDGYRHF